MRTLLVSLLLAISISAAAQSKTPSRKDTVKLDSTQVEKIKKMPMDTISDKMPVVPLPPPKKKEAGDMRKP